MNTRISDQDIQHLRAFSDTHRAAVMQKVMSRAPIKTVVMDGCTQFEKTLIKLRRDGFGLIDLQPQEAACASFWYRKKPTLLKPSSADVAMLLWEAQERGEATTLITWQV